MFRYVILVFAVTYFFVRSSFAGVALYNGVHQQFQSTRAMGMGNAFIADADDENAMFYNPAGMQQLSEAQMNFFLKLGADPDIKKFADDIDKAGKDSNAITDTIQKNYGQHFSARAPSLGFIWARPKWSFAFIPMDVSIDAALHREIGPAINLYVIQDTTAAYARTWNVKQVTKGKLDLGFTAKAIYRGQLDKIVDIASIQNDKILEAEDSNEGLTVDFDFGAMWKAPEATSGFWSYAKPTLGAVVRNVLDYGYISSFGLYAKDKKGDPEKLHRVLDLGSSFKLPNWWVWSSTLNFDVRDILHPNWTINKGIHLGLESNWEMASWWKGGWRLGLNQMYWTAGFTGQLGVFRMDLSSFGREVGTRSHKKEDRVYMLTMALDF